MARHGKPDIFNTNQASQFTGSAFTGVLATNGITISMDGKSGLAGQRVRRAPVAQRQIRGGVSVGKAYPMLALRSAATWTFIMGGVHTRVLTAPRPIKPTSPRCHFAWQPNPGSGPSRNRPHGHH
jgi:putative transposase